MVRGNALAYLGRSDEGIGELRDALTRADQHGDPLSLLRAYVLLTDALTMLGRPRESALLAQVGLDSLRRYEIDSTVLVSNYIESLVAIGEWDTADQVSQAAMRAITANYPYMLLMNRADIEIGRGLLDAAREHLDAASVTLREDRGLGIYDVYLAELALWESRWTDADAAVRDGLARATSSHTAQIRVWLCAKGLRTHAELAALARARRDDKAASTWLARAQVLITLARQAAAEASSITPNANGWLALAEAECARGLGRANPELWADAAEAWERLERPPAAAYCRWRQSEAFVAIGAARTVAGAPLSEAHAIALRIDAKPLLREVDLLARRARLDPTSRAVSPASPSSPDLTQILGLSAREVEVLSLVGRGCTNREIAETLVISVKTASVHVSHILRKLGVNGRGEAAAIAHRLAAAPPTSE
jgi:DNA-binding CsgD family transcriptional regulator